jgi:hypothetical protein
MNPQLLKAKEEAILQRITEIMFSYGLNYLQIDDEQSEYQYQLEPPIQKLALFSDDDMNPSLKACKYTLRQMLAHLVKLTL